MKLQIILNVNYKTPKNYFKKVFDTTLKELSQIKKFEEFCKNKKLEINLVITNDEEMKELNKKWRDKNKTTDVLSFPYFDLSEKTTPGVLKITSPLKVKSSVEIFGEILISLPQCKKQADNLNHSLQKEVSILFIHGLLHLFGYDHIKEKDFLDMNSLEQKIDKQLESA